MSVLIIFNLLYNKANYTPFNILNRIIMDNLCICIYFCIPFTIYIIFFYYVFSPNYTLTFLVQIYSSKSFNIMLIYYGKAKFTCNNTLIEAAKRYLIFNKSGKLRKANKIRDKFILFIPDFIILL